MKSSHSDQNPDTRGPSVSRLAGIVILACLLAACGGTGREPGANGNGSISFTDELGRRVVLKSSPKRIISLAPSVTEMLFALGLDDRVVGVTTWCDFPEQANRVEKIGDTLNPDLERVIALKPDLIVVTTASQLESLTRRLDKLSIPVYVIDPRTVRRVAYSIESLGRVTGSTEGSKIAAGMERRITAVQDRVKNLPRLRVLYALQNSPLITAGQNTFINDLINLAGGISISGQESADYPQFSRETVIARAPEVIVIPGSHGSSFISEEELARSFGMTPAIRNRRIVQVNADWISRPGPRIVDGLEQLAQGLHPEEVESKK